MHTCVKQNQKASCVKARLDTEALNLSLLVGYLLIVDM
jgi:hypothetical protein